MQHYGLTGTSTEAQAIEARAAAVLGFLIRFPDEELLPALTEAERSAVQGELSEIRASLIWICRFTTKRMQRLIVDVEPFRTCTVECSDCYQLALVVSVPEGARCYFCWSRRPIDEAMRLYCIATSGRPTVGSLLHLR
ncbi:hypothetical protein [Streptomyces kanamyceticus]|uniref:Uncharacterized protein n=1 Tax=Streptomyces kanamyceticus TaxID=1967 RepID=A0A5J6GAK6_STRKN|nr:hypothetical protein [Streptomyces kanamyceticus]QEU90938.1 hypothetical protein CP970_08620 [Streptomyces kanamyceticus]